MCFPWRTNLSFWGLPMLKIKNHRLAGVPFVAANASGGDMTPSLIVVHDTAGRLDRGSSVAWFRSRDCKTSAHLVVEVDGSVTQMVPFNKKAWHAGKSSWRGKTFCNAFAIGIEIVNPGALKRDGRAWFHTKPTDRGFPVADIVHKATPEHGDAWWLPYTDAQIKSVKELCRAICEEYPDCNEIVTHWMISPKRKIDTNPLFPLEDVRAYAFGIDDGHEDEGPDKPPADVIAQPAPPPTAAHSTEVQTATVTGATGAFGLYQAAQPSLVKATTSGQLNTQALVWALVTDPIFMGLLAGVFCAAYAYFKRVSRLKTLGV